MHTTETDHFSPSLDGLVFSLPPLPAAPLWKTRDETRPRLRMETDFVGRPDGPLVRLRGFRPAQTKGHGAVDSGRSVEYARRRTRSTRPMARSRNAYCYSGAFRQCTQRVPEGT